MFSQAIANWPLLLATPELPFSNPVGGAVFFAEARESIGPAGIAVLEGPDGLARYSSEESPARKLSGVLQEAAAAASHLERRLPLGENQTTLKATLDRLTREPELTEEVNRRGIDELAAGLRVFDPDQYRRAAYRALHSHGFDDFEGPRINLENRDWAMLDYARAWRGNLLSQMLRRWLAPVAVGGAMEFIPWVFREELESLPPWLHQSLMVAGGLVGGVAVLALTVRALFPTYNMLSTLAAIRSLEQKQKLALPPR